VSAADPRLPPLPNFQAVLSGVGACASHPTRDAVALCRRCLMPCCGECATRRADINYCAGCISALDAELLAIPGSRQVRAAQAASAFAWAGTPLRLLVVMAAYGLLTLLAASYGVGMPFFANERRQQANQERLADVQQALTSYQNDVGKYPASDRGLAALLSATDDDRDTWRGPYITAQANGGRAGTSFKPAVFDVFGQPILYYAKPGEDEEMAEVYIASRGGNGSWDTPGIETGNPPHEASGDDVLKWVVWQ